MPLNAKKGLFGIQAAAKSGQGSVRPNNPVAWDDDSHGIAADGAADSPDRPGPPDGAGNIAIAPQFPKADSLQVLPNRFLEIRPGQGNGHGKSFQVPGKIGRQFPRRPREDIVILLFCSGENFSLFGMGHIREKQADQGGFACI